MGTSRSATSAITTGMGRSPGLAGSRRACACSHATAASARMTSDARILSADIGGAWCDDNAGEMHYGDPCVVLPPVADPLLLTLLLPLAFTAAVVVDGVTVVGGVTSGTFEALLVKPPLAAGGEATGATGVVDSGVAGSDGRITAVVPAPLPALAALAAPGHGGHAVDAGIASAGKTPAVLVDAPADDAAPVAFGTPRMAPVPLVCARTIALDEKHATVSKQLRSVIASAFVCTRCSTLRLLTQSSSKESARNGSATART